MAQPLGPTALADVTASLRDELDQLVSIFATCMGDRTVLTSGVPYVPTEDGCLVSLWDAWNRFVRNLLLTCSAGPVLGLSGTVHAPSVPMSPAKALAHIVANKNKTNIKVIAGEPKWFDVRAIADLTQVLGLANGITIVSAITSSTIQLGSFSVANPLEEIRVCRNFIAHKCDGALAEVMNLAGTGFVDMSSHVRGRRFGVEVYSEWSDACVALAEAAAQ
jgi:hypothetical protein